MKGYYFSKEDCKLGYGDGREISVGITHSVDLPIKLCKNGLHASLSPLDALTYARGSTLWLVELSGDIEKGRDKVCAEKRTYLHKIEAKELLEKFARKCALAVIHLWDPPKVVVDFLKTGDEKLRLAAWNAARSAAWNAARNAAMDASRSAAKVTAWDAAEAAARDAAEAADGYAAWYAARTRVKTHHRNTQEKRLKDLIDKAIKDGA